MKRSRDNQGRGPKRAPGVTRRLVEERLQQGMTVAEIARDLGVVKSTVCYHARRLGLAANPRFARRYDWREVQRYYDEGHSIRECARTFGFATETWHRAVRVGLLESRPAAAPIETYLVQGRRVNRHHLKGRLLAAGLKDDACEQCGVSEWRGQRLSMALHHVNGDGMDNRLQNLELLCPNCHSQTPNFAAKKLRIERRRREFDALCRRVGLMPIGATRRLPVIGTVS